MASTTSRPNLRRGLVAGFASTAAVLLACSAALACQTFAGAWTWTTNAGSGNVVSTVGANNSSSCDGNIGAHHQGATAGLPLPSVNAPAGSGALDLTVTVSASDQCTRNDPTLCPSPAAACNKPKAGSYELYKFTANGEGVDGSMLSYHACHAPQGGNTARVQSSNVFVVDSSGNGSYTWNDFKTETNSGNTGLYRNFCIWEDGGSSSYADSINFLSV